MPNSCVAKELVVEAADEKGLLAKIAQAVSSQGVNVQAICACSEEGKAYFMLVTSDNAKATEALKNAGYSPTEKEVVVAEMEDKVGMLAEVSRKISDAGVNMGHIYGTVPGSGAVSTIVVSGSDNAKIKEILA
jgi:hypothetical protein